jgi:hypothetical protein
MKIIRSLALAVALSFLSLSANAMSIKYDMTYNADVGGGADGIGSFSFDAGTNFLSGLNWSFDDGLSGLYFDKVDEFLGSDVLLGNCTSGFQCSATRVPPEISGDFSNVVWSFSSPPATRTYQFSTSSSLTHFGTYTVTEAVSVTEPGTFALLSIGLLGMGLARRKKA